MRRLKTPFCRLFYVGLLFVTAYPFPVAAQAPQATRVTVFEGARLIVGDGSAPIEGAAFIVENNRFTQVGRKGQLQVPAGAARIDLTGKTVMPGNRRRSRPSRVSRCRHRKTIEGEFYARELHRSPRALRLPWHRRDHQHGHRHGGARVSAARGNNSPMRRSFAPSASDSPIRDPDPPMRPETTCRMRSQASRRRAKPFRTWRPTNPISSKSGSTADTAGSTKLTPEIFAAAADEAHKQGLRSIAHVFDLADAKLLVTRRRRGIPAQHPRPGSRRRIYQARERAQHLDHAEPGRDQPRLADSRERHAGVVRRAVGA